MSGQRRLPSLYPSKEGESRWWKKILEESRQYQEIASKPKIVREAAHETRPIRPQEDNITISVARSHVVDKVVKILQDKENFQRPLRITTSGVYEGGSVKQGTAVLGHYDIDLVLYSASLAWEKCLENNGYPEELNKINQHFQETIGEDYYELKKKSRVTLEFEYKKLEDGCSITVKLSLSPFWQNPEELFDVLQTVDSQEKRELFVHSTIKLQTEYIQCMDRAKHRKYRNDWACQHVHQLIQRAKAWAIVQDWPIDDNGVVQKPNSYLLSLLVIETYKIVEPKEFKKLSAYGDSVTVEFKKMVKEFAKKEDWDELGPPENEGLKRIRAQYSHLLPASRWLIDPANPANNVYESGMSGRRKDKGWKAFEERIDSIDLNLDVNEIK